MKYLAFRIAQYLARSTPRRVAYWIGDLIAWFHWQFSHHSREAVLANLTIIHTAAGDAVSPEQLRREAREVFRNFAKYVVDFFSLFHLADEQRRKLIHLAGLPELLRKCLAHGKGVITVTAHMGNWELGGAAMCMSGFKVNAVALVQADPKLNQLFQSQRLARGMQVIPMGHAAKPALKALRRNEIVAVLGDRDFTGARMTMNFLGRPARLPHGPARLAEATGAAVVVAMMVRRPDDTYEYQFAEPIFPQGLTGQQVAERIARDLEMFIRRHPTQWYIFTRFWDIEEDLAVAHGALAATLHSTAVTNATSGQQ
jgi:KDO2-lipid IV(A) lauroyltransferase